MFFRNIIKHLGWVALLASWSCSSDLRGGNPKVDCDLGPLCESRKSLGPAEVLVSGWGSSKTLLFGVGDGLDLLSPDGSRQRVRNGPWGSLAFQPDRIHGLLEVDGGMVLWEFPSGKELQLHGRGHHARLQEAERWRRRGPAGGRPYPFQVCDDAAWYLREGPDPMSCGGVQLVDLQTGAEEDLGDACEFQNEHNSFFASFSEDCRYLSINAFESFDRIDLRSGERRSLGGASDSRVVSRSGSRVLFSERLEGTQSLALFVTDWPFSTVLQLAEGPQDPTLSRDGRYASFNDWKDFVVLDLLLHQAFIIDGPIPAESSAVHSPEGGLVVFQHRFPFQEGFDLMAFDAATNETIPISTTKIRWGHPVASARGLAEIPPPHFSENGRFLVWEDVEDGEKLVSFADLERGETQELHRGSLDSKTYFSPGGEQVVIHGTRGCLYFADLRDANRRGCITRGWTGPPVIHEDGVAYLDWKGEVILLPLD